MGEKVGFDKNKDDLNISERIKQLEEEFAALKENYRDLEDEKKFVENERIRYEREARKLRSEIEKLRSPPLPVGHVSDVLEDGRIIIRSSTGPKFVVHASQFIDEDEIKPGSRVAMNQQTLAIISLLPASKDPSIYGFEIDVKPKVKFSDIGGLKKQIDELKETVELPMLKPELFKEIGIEPPKGVLLYGPPGTGKTLLAKAVANTTNATFIRVVGSEFVQKFIGEGARLVREVFELAEEKSPSIIFIDEIDALAARRIGNDVNGDREVQRTLMQLLAEMDGFDPRGEVKIIGATNRIDILDPAILRPGRFDRVVEIPLPSLEEREQIFRVHTRNMKLDESIKYEKLAEMTEAISGAEIKAIVTEAGIAAIREERSTVRMDDFLKAINKVMGKEEGAPAKESMFA